MHFFAESEINQSGSNVSSKFTSGLSWAVSSIAAKLTRTRDDTQENPGSKIGNLPATSAAAANKGSTNSSQIKSISHSDEQYKATKNTIDDSKSFASDLDIQASEADGWGDDNWDNDDISQELGELKLEENAPSATSKNKFAIIEEKNAANAWDDDFPMDDWNSSSDWQSTEISLGKNDKVGNDEHIFQEPVVRKPTTNIRRTANTTSSNLTKKGPMKLGAKNSSKMN